MKFFFFELLHDLRSDHAPALAIFELVREFRLRVALAQQQQQQLVQSSKDVQFLFCFVSIRFVARSGVAEPESIDVCIYV